MAQKCECPEQQTIHLKMVKFYVNFIIIKIKDNTCGMLCNLGSTSHSTLRLFKIREHLVFIFVPRKWLSAGHRESTEGLLDDRVSE